MLEILGITTPIFLLIGLGYLAMRLRLTTREQLQGVGSFVMYFALPALVIRALSEHPLDEVMHLGYLLAYGLGSLAVFLLALAITRWQRKPLNAGALYALGMAASNSGFVGYPVAFMVLGSPAAIFLALNMLVENLLIIPAALILAELGSQRGATLRATLQQTASRLARNPIILGLLVGVGLSLSDLSLPGPIAQTIGMLATAAAPAALFVIGGSLYGLKTRGMASDVGLIVIGKLILHPLAVLAMLLILPPMDPLLMAGALLFACAPMISVYPLFGQRYGVGEISAAALMVATLGSFFSLSLAIWLMSLARLLPG
ncbi:MULTISPECIES: AEC family transporter [Halomonadaceae]|uniref:AEC family transporter n=1 Tax=Halomonadaceae TaxID=28256 RepID=UPI0015975A55|nr:MULTISPECIES: AEC family transporter [Halomonas]QJQ94188.1 AEC family transporter [Halomonas sp. PA5]